VDSVGVQFEALASGGDGINGVYQSLLGTLDGLEGELKPMMSSWSGDAQQSYHIQKKSWDEAAQALGTILAQLGQAVHGAHDNYRSTENKIGNMWNGG
jgi:6 kDa early secretory antigenic target